MELPALVGPRAGAERLLAERLVVDDPRHPRVQQGAYGVVLDGQVVAVQQFNRFVARRLMQPRCHLQPPFAVVLKDSNGGGALQALPEISTTSVRGLAPIV